MKANLTTICSIDTQEEIRGFLNKFFAGVDDLTEQKRNQVVLAVDEAIANAIIHGNDRDTEKSIQLDLDVNKKRIHIEISDIGLFDEIMNNDKKDKDLKTVIKEKQKGGLGLKLIYSIMDVVCFYTKNNKSYCLMVKLLN
jgi:serine/threonine-protein kinase RsbW